MEKNKMSPSYSKSKVSAFLGSHTDPQLRESIRQDVLIERYDDLQKEMDHIEDLLNISEDHFNDDLFAINEVLFEMLETLVPELIKEDDDCDDVNEVKLSGMPTIQQKTAKTGSTSGDPDIVGQRTKGKGDDAGKPAKNVDAIRKKRVADIKARETKAMRLSKDKESIIRVKSLIRTAQMTAKGADNPESKKRARHVCDYAQKIFQKIKVGGVT